MIFVIVISLFDCCGPGGVQYVINSFHILLSNQYVSVFSH